MHNWGMCRSVVTLDRVQALAACRYKSAALHALDTSSIHPPEEAQQWQATLNSRRLGRSTCSI